MRSLFFILLVFASSTASLTYLSAEDIYDGTIIDRAGSYDGYPSHIFINGTHHLFFCGETPASEDGIYHSQSTTELRSATGWSPPTLIFSNADSPWATHHVCDPSILAGPFSYDASTYQYILFYTADDGSQPVGVKNAIGVAYSNDLLAWTPNPSRIIQASDTMSEEYGAGECSVAWNPDSSTFSLLYRDSTYSSSFWGSILHVASSDGSNFSSPPFETALTSSMVNQTAPDIAYSPHDSSWYALVHTIPPTGDPPAMSVKLMRSTLPGSLLGSWELVDEWNMSFSGEETNFQAGLGRNSNGTLFVDDEGWMFVFMTTGDWFPDFHTWKISQIRRRFIRPQAPISEDTFAHVGPARADGESLANTFTEIGAKQWTAGSSLIFHGGGITTSTSGTGAFATIPVASPGVGSTPTSIDVQAQVDVTGSTWGAIGFSTSNAGVFGGEIWLLLKNNTQTAEVVADGSSLSLVSVQAPRFSSGTNDLALHYDQATNTVTAWLNHVRILDSFDLDNVGFLPDIQRAGFHFSAPTANQTLIDSFTVNRRTIFFDGFESGNTSRWTSTISDQ